MIEHFWTHSPRGSRRFALAVGAVAIATPLVALLHALLPESSLAVAYLPAVIGDAVLAGRAPALLAAALAFLAYNFCSSSRISRCPCATIRNGPTAWCSRPG